MEKKMNNTKFTLVYWKGEKYWLGKLLEHPDIMTQGATLEELEDNIREAFYLMNFDDVPEERQFKEILV
jgi:predicted RNase H-like HicB family nuclease